MLAKLTSKNQLTLPVESLRQMPRAEYFEVTLEAGHLVLAPVAVVPAFDLERIRDAIEASRLTEAAVEEAVDRARRAV